MTALRVTNYPRQPSTSASPTIQAIAQRIHDQRYTYPSVADKAGISEWAVRRICRGKCSPSIALVERLAAAVGLEIVITASNSI